ncbi:S-layer homology domain-containing protein [Paenibacillus sp. GYB004]|uniref:S-layer homology domain-containing protein n=1 Tax=Paenibacillus sp. GYB004 TaxID=2994393 RepID=UPI002F96491C
MRKPFVVLGTVMALAVLPSYTSTASNTKFTDVEGHWFSESVANATTKGYVDGYEDGSFRPDLEVSRAEFVKMVVSFNKLPVERSGSGEWFDPYIKTAIDSGILSNSDFAQQDVHTPISRVEMAKISLRAVKSDFKNKPIDDATSMIEATQLGLVQGLAYGELSPKGQTTRAQSVTIVERILTAKAGGQLQVDQIAVVNAWLAKDRTNMFTKAPEIFGGEQRIALSSGNMSLITPDGNYKSTVDQIVVIDLADQLDPNLHLLGDVETLKWFNQSSQDSSPLIRNFRNSYILYFKGTVDYNKDTTKYDESIKTVLPVIKGFAGNVSELQEGKLSQPAVVFRNYIGDVPAIIVPKTGYTLANTITMGIIAPEIMPYKQPFTKTILSIDAPKIDTPPTAEQLKLNDDVQKRMKELEELAKKQLEAQKK